MWVAIDRCSGSSEVLFWVGGERAGGGGGGGGVDLLPLGWPCSQFFSIAAGPSSFQARVGFRFCGVFICMRPRGRAMVGLNATLGIMSWIRASAHCRAERGRGAPPKVGRVPRRSYVAEKRWDVRMCCVTRRMPPSRLLTIFPS